MHADDRLELALIAALRPPALAPDLIGRVGGLHDAMAAAGLAPDQFKPILIDEGSYTGPAGRWSGRGTSTADPADPFNRAQRDYVTKALARSAYTGAQGFLWFLLRDSGGGLGSDVAYGLRDATGSPKPSFHAYRYFSGLIDRGDRLVGALSPGSPKLEGYEFTATDGRQVQVVWNEADDEAVSYAPAGAVAAVTDSVGNPLPASGNSVAVGAEPRFIFYTP